MKGEDAIRSLKKKLKVDTDRELASRLGQTEMNVQNWKNCPNVTPLQLANLVDKAAKAATKSAHRKALRPVVEFYPIHKAKSSQGAQFELFSAMTEDGHAHPYRTGLKAELGTLHGVYIFFDSRGKAIYAGKAKKQSLWKEMNLAFNRKRRFVQTIKRVAHPASKVEYKTAEEKSRQIVGNEVPLHELSFYFSAYLVDDEMINKLEALLVRSFANDLLNKNMERFGRQRKTKKKKKK